MLVVKIELHSAVTGKITTLHTGTIFNDGSGTGTVGNYRYEFRDKSNRPYMRGELKGFPRKKENAWRLLGKCLENYELQND